MRQRRPMVLAAIAASLYVWSGIHVHADETLFRNLPGGVILDSCEEVPPARAEAIGKKLGGKYDRMANSVLRVNGRKINVNTVTAVDESNASAIYDAIAKLKSHPSFCVRQGRLVVEYVGRDLDAAFATITSYELGLLPKPASLRYRVTAELATVDKADYMSCNLLFNQFLALGASKSPSATEQLVALSKRFQFGRTLYLRNPALGKSPTAHRFQPPAIDWRESAASVAYSFPPLPERYGVPFVVATIEITVDGTGFRESAAEPPTTLTAATTYWPATDPNVVALARRITAGKSNNDDKIAAILEWLTPGRNLKYSGQTGSRWGAATVLDQKFGRCWDFSDCFITLARSAGVPCRQVAGWLYCGDGHVWAEYYREGKGWQQVDPTGGGKVRCGLYHIPYFTSENGEMPVVYLGMPKIECFPLQ